MILDAVAQFAIDALDNSSETSPIDSCRAIAILASLGNSAANSVAAASLRRWWERVAVKPPAFEFVTEAQALDAPVRGVGSPNGVAITTVYKGSRVPIRLVSAGRTPDELVNSWLDDAIFATALACNAEPTILSTAGSVLTLSGKEGPSQADEAEPVVSAVLGPSGLVEPTGKAPSLGLSFEQSLSLVAEVFRRLETSSGLVRAETWDARDGEALDAAVQAALANPEVQDVRSDPKMLSVGAVLHATPFTDRSPDGQVTPISISIPYQLLGAQRLFGVLRAARTVSLDGLTRDAKHRESVARRAKEDHQQAMDEWQARGAEGQQEECRRRPEVTVTHRYDFRLGRHVRLPQSLKVARRTYEEEYRPQIVRGATEFEQRFHELVASLDAIAVPGGRADMLTLKLLVDSAIRGASLPLAAAGFQKDFERWSAIAAPTIWAHVMAWCAERGYPLEELAAPNVVFNVRLDWRKSQLILEPWALVDLQNYVIEVDPLAGRLRICMGSRPASVEDTVLSNERFGRLDALGLHTLFDSWLERHPYPLTIATSHEGLIPAEMLNGEHRTPILFAFARTLFLAGKWEDARRLVLQIRNEDRPEIYFLGALTYLAGSPFLRQRPEYQAITKLGDHESRARQECTLACDLIMGGRDTNHFPQECRRFLEQLVACDPAFLGKLLLNRTSSHPLSVLQDQESDQNIQSASAAASALELLHLAETASEVARRLPASGPVAGVVKRDLIALCDQADRLAFVQVSTSSGFDELRMMLD